MTETPECGAVQPGTLGYQRCTLPVGHDGEHRSQDRYEWLPGLKPVPARPVDRAARKADAAEWAGFRQATFAQETGTMVVVLNAEEAGTDPESGAWSTICDDHNHCTNHPTLALARSHASNPLGWCEACRALADGFLLDEHHHLAVDDDGNPLRAVNTLDADVVDAATVRSEDSDAGRLPL